MSGGRLRAHLRGWVWSARFAYGHPSNEARRLRAVGSATLAKLVTRLTRRDLVVPFGLRSRALVTQRARVSERCAAVAIPDWNELQAWRRRLDRGDLFVDVGANVGFYTLVMAEHGAKVVAVEPHPGTGAVLVDNIRLNGFDVEVHAVALSSEPGEMRLHGEDLSRMRLGAEGTPVRVDTLDGILADRVAHGVKIDVEGFERHVLLGGMAALAEGRIRALQLEWGDQSERNVGESRRATADLLARFGFAFFRPDHSGVLVPADPAALGSDIFAIPERPAVSSGAPPGPAR